MDFFETFEDLNDGLLFSKPGSKLQFWSKILFVFLLVCTFALFIIILVSSTLSSDVVGLILSFVFLVIGLLFSFIYALLMFGFGKLIETNQSIKALLQNTLSKAPTNKTPRV